MVKKGFLCCFIGVFMAFILETESYEKFKLKREIRRRFHSVEGLALILREIIDFNPEKLNSTLFEYACQTLEKEGFKPSEYKGGISYLMRLKLSDIIERTFDTCKNRREKTYLTCNSDSINELVNYEHQNADNATFPWNIISGSNGSDYKFVAR